MQAIKPLYILLFTTIKILQVFPKMPEIINKNWQKENRFIHETLEGFLYPHIRPYHVALKSPNNFCGGALIHIDTPGNQDYINGQYIITSSECIPRDLNQLEVILGAHDLSLFDPYRYSVKALHTYGHNGSSTFPLIPILVVLEEAPILTPKLMPITIPLLNKRILDFSNSSIEEVYTFTSGWPENGHELKSHEYKLISQAECQTFYPDIDEMVFCAVETKGWTTPKGQGNPAVIGLDNYEYLIGVSLYEGSKIMQNGQKRMPTVFANILKYYEDIADIIALG